MLLYNVAVQKQTSVTAHWTRLQLLLFVFALHLNQTENLELYHTIQILGYWGT